MAIFVCANNLNLSVESLSSNAGKGVFKHPGNSTGFFILEDDMENQRRKFYSEQEIKEIRRGEWAKVRKAVFLAVVLVALMESGRILNIIQTAIGG